MTLSLEVSRSIINDLVRQLLEAKARFNYVSSNCSLNIFNIVYFNNFEDSNGKQYHIDLQDEDMKQYGINVHQENIVKFRVSY